jgi:DNA-binding response OmpR family regulator
MPTRVLVIEDDPDIRAMMTEALECEGYDVAQAPDGAEGLRVAREQAPDLILLDLMMPVMDGRTFRANQRLDRALARIPVIVVSALRPDSTSGLDAVAYLHKPFDLDDLYRLVARYDARQGYWSAS